MASARRAAADVQAEVAAESLFDEGKALAAQGKWKEACPKFEESLRLDRAGGTLLNLARCHEHVGRLAEAWEEYTEARARAGLDERPDRVEAAQAGLDAVGPRLPHLRVHVGARTRAMGATVRLKDTVLLPPSWDTRLPVDPGHVTVRAEAPGHWPWATAFDVTDGQDLVLEVPDLVPTPPPPEGFRWTPRHTLAATIFAAGVASLAVGTYFGLQTFSERSASDAGCPGLDGSLRCSVQASSAMSTAYRDAWIADFTLGAGALAAAAGAYLFFTVPGPSPEHRAPAPTVTTGFRARPGGGDVTLGGCF